MSGNKVFFEHINGLRGLAIIAIVFFHLAPDVFPNCFYGVDVFLVITGYLLFLGLSRQDGSLHACGRFAMKRVTRILPPVSILILLTLLAGIFLLDYRDVTEASRLGRYTLFGMANVHLNKIASDYFASDFWDNPLMHMWYLGVTLQVYLMFVVGNVICKKVPRRVWMTVLIVLAIVSLVLRYHSEFSWLGMPVLTDKVGLREPSYYETLPRVWEVLAGGLVFLLPSVNSRFWGNFLTCLGLFAVLFPMLMTHESGAIMFPVIVLGAVLIIRYMPHSSLSFLLSNRAFLFVGTISFSLYLVHLPIFIFYKNWAFRAMGILDYAIMLLLSFGGAWVFYTLVERRKWNWKVWVPIWGFGVLMCVVLHKTNGLMDGSDSEADRQLLPVYTQWKQEGNPKLYQGFDRTAIGSEKGVFVVMEVSKPQEDIYMLRIGDCEKTPSFVLVGDSHAQVLYSGLDTLCAHRDKSCAGVYLATIISPFWNIAIPPAASGVDYYCDRAKMEAFMDWLEKHPELKHVVVAQYWLERMKYNKFDWDMNKTNYSDEEQTERLRDFCSRVKRLGKQVILIGPTPDYTIHPPRCARIQFAKHRDGGTYTPLECSRQVYMERHGKIIEMLKKMEEEGLASLLDLSSVVPQGESFRAYENGVLYFRDKNHLSVAGAIMYMTKLKERFFELISE